MADLTPLDILDQKTALQAYVSAPVHDQRVVCVYCSCVLVAGPLATFAHELPLLSDLLPMNCLFCACIHGAGWSESTARRWWRWMRLHSRVVSAQCIRSEGISCFAQMRRR